MDEGRSFDSADESLLEAALNQAFTPPPRNPTSHDGRCTSRDNAEAAISDTPPAPKPLERLVSNQVLESWTSEYESQVETWRSQSAEAREKAEKERARWEGIRVRERESSLQDSNEGWERVGSKGNNSLAPSSVSGFTSSVADSGRDIATVELPAVPHNPGPGPPPSQSEGSQKWEDVPSSITSSFPSMSFPEHTENSSPIRQRPEGTKAPVSATLAIFDSSLSTRTRVKALFSSLAINFFLPFVNGVMLGFGEIFAKNIVLEWWRPGSSATMTGIRGGQTLRMRRS
ncbi:uncharacterized protein BT62DRAFT_1000342 [Guyanagaster necrorhizus]|uniref:Uncharacterized protein n=1 Tax=Guyanagaster necrorhizus TaxID=856835 RepID=A0A9P7W355_9AGAR|nr:uncharacterized protein BT62DRAFT_1000342 [Guyanagaster necrorhizus MCA 3950]KAG7451110.1 hypothetical protein BT62DRAFT_1000342 [Guyanagaster necrorhizus MCA 3950]